MILFTSAKWNRYHSLDEIFLDFHLAYRDRDVLHELDASEKTTEAPEQLSEEEEHGSETEVWDSRSQKEKANGGLHICF